MALEALLPSEIARLVYGYLIDEKCTETAKTFLNESPNLYECRSVLQYGRTFTTRVCGLALLDILEKFCTVNSIVQEQITIFDSTHKLKYCKDVVGQIKFLFEDSKNQQATSSSNERIQNGHTVSNGTPIKAYKKRYSGKNENRSNAVTQSDDGYQTETPPDSNSTHNTPSLETTPLENLPGYIEALQSKMCEIPKPNSVKTPITTEKTNKVSQSKQFKPNVKSQEVQTSMRVLEPYELSKPSQTDSKLQSQGIQRPVTILKANELSETTSTQNIIQEIQNKSNKQSGEYVKILNSDSVGILGVETSSRCINSKVQTDKTDLCNTLRNHITDENQEVISLDDSEEQTSLESLTPFDSGIKVSETCIEILEDVQTELLNRTEIQEKIASNINKLMEPIKNCSQLQSVEGSVDIGTKSFIAELDKMIGLAVNMTENDPMFVELLSSIMKLDEHVSSSEEVEMDIDYENPNTEKHVSNQDVLIIEANNQVDPEVITIDSINISQVQNAQDAINSEVTNTVTSTQTTRILGSEVSNKAGLAKQTTQLPQSNNLNNAVTSGKLLINSTEPPTYDKNFPNPPDFYQESNTMAMSTPLKLYTATQNYDTNEWFSTQALPSPNIIALVESTAVVTKNFPYTQTSVENIGNPVDAFISPIICKENCKVAEKISLNCSSAKVKEDETLHTPDVPVVTKSFIPSTATPSILTTNVLPQEKTPIFIKKSDGEIVSPNMQLAQKTSPSFNSISSLVKDTEFNRYFSIDSINVCNMDNTASTNVQNPSTVPEVVTEDSVGFTGTGLSPFLKLHKRTEEDNVVIQKNENLAMSDVAIKTVEETQTALNEKLSDTNLKVSDVSIKSSLDEKVKESDNVMKDQMVTSIPVISKTDEEIVSEITTNEVDKIVELITTDIVDNKATKNEDAVMATNTSEIIQTIDSETTENVDLNPKIVTIETNDGTDRKTEKNMEVLSKLVSNESTETNEVKTDNNEDATSKTCCETYVTNKNVLISNEIEIENSKHDESKIETGISNKESLKSFINKTYESYIDTSKENVVSNNSNEIITRNTPKVISKEDAKSNRRSLSTPKKPSSHIRALTFETPIQSRSDSKINDKTRCLSPESAKRNLKSLHKSFQSPPIGHSGLDNQVQYTDVKEKIPESITTSMPKDKENVHDEKLIDTTSSLSEEKENEEKTKEVNKNGALKKSWDSDLRKLLGQGPEPVKVEGPKRKYKTKLKEEGSAKKKKRDKSKTPKKEKKSDKTPHKKSKKSEKEKTPKKSKKHNKSREDKVSKNDNKNTKNKTGDTLSAKECKDISAQIENNLMLNENNIVSNKLEGKNKAEDKLSAKEYEDVSAQIEKNLMLLENKKVKNKIENNEVSDKSQVLQNSETKKIETNVLSSKNDELLPSVENNSTGGNQKTTMNSKKDVNLEESSKVNSKVEENLTVNENKEVLSKVKKKDPLEYLLSDSVNDEDVLNDVMVLESDDIMYHEELSKANEQNNSDIVDKMQQDEESIVVVLEEANHAVNEKYKSENEIKQQDFFPETSIMTDVEAESETEEEIEEPETTVPSKDNNNKSLDKENVELEDVNNPKLEKESDRSLQENEKHNVTEPQTDKDTKTASACEDPIDYETIEKQLSILTNTEVSSARKVIYDQVSKVEGGKVVKKKYARLQTLNTKSAANNKLISMSGYEIVLDSSPSVKGDDSLEMPATPKIASPGSNSWAPNPLVKEDSRTIHSSIPTPIECPPTPKIFITPQKIEKETVDAVPQKTDVPFYHLTPITFETNVKPEVTNLHKTETEIVNPVELAKKTEITEFEVVKETLLKNTTPKTLDDQKAEENENIKNTKKTPGSLSSSYRDKSSSHLDSEDSDSSSSSNSSDSSCSSSDDEDEHSLHPLEPVQLDKNVVETMSKLEKKRECHIVIHNEEVVSGNEVILIEHEEIVVATESSPTKVIPIHKTDKELEETIKETPAKDENMIPEEGIFETPNVSKPVETPTNLHAKISQIMIQKEQEEIRNLENQQKPKILNIERVSTKIIMKNPTPLTKLSPSNLQITALQPKDNHIKSEIVDKSEEEVAKAIESITNQNFDKSQDNLDANVANTTSPEIPSDNVKKRELVKAIQSITKDDEEENSELSSDNDSSDSDSEPNLELVLEDDMKRPQPVLSDEASIDETFGFDNCERQHIEHHIIFDEANYKKRRRKQFTDEMMTLLPQDEDGNEIAKLTPTSVDILFNLIPPKKKVGPKKKIKEEIKEEEEEFDDGDSSEDFVPVKNSKGSTKRKRSGEEPKSRKRSRNIFIY